MAEKGVRTSGKPAPWVLSYASERQALKTQDLMEGEEEEKKKTLPLPLLRSPHQSQCLLQAEQGAQLGWAGPLLILTPVCLRMTHFPSLGLFPHLPTWHRVDSMTAEALPSAGS